MIANTLECMAETLLMQLNSGEVVFELSDIQVGVPKEAARSLFAEWVEEVRQDPDATEEISEMLKAAEVERRMVLLSSPDLVTDAELAAWLDASGTYERLFDLGSVFPLTDDPDGPSATIGTRGEIAGPEYQVFDVATTRKEALASWATNWLQ